MVKVEYQNSQEWNMVNQNVPGESNALGSTGDSSLLLKNNASQGVPRGNTGSLHVPERDTIGWYSLVGDTGCRTFPGRNAGGWNNVEESTDTRVTVPMETVDGGDWNDSQQQQESPRGRRQGDVAAVAAGGTGARGTSKDTSTTVVLLVVPQFKKNNKKTRYNG